MKALTELFALISPLYLERGEFPSFLYSLLCSPTLLKVSCQPISYTVLSLWTLVHRQSVASRDRTRSGPLTMASQSVLRIARVRNMFLSVSTVQLTRACRK